jgi:hypothetical protein
MFFFIRKRIKRNLTKRNLTTRKPARISPLRTYANELERKKIKQGVTVQQIIQTRKRFSGLRNYVSFLENRVMRIPKRRVSFQLRNDTHALEVTHIENGATIQKIINARRRFKINNVSTASLGFVRKYYAHLKKRSNN